MSGETDLEKLLASMRPQLLDGEYVFRCFENAVYGDHTDLEPVASFRESEGLTLVVPVAKAKQKGLSCDSPFRCISLGIHSSLDAVGLTTAFSNNW